MHSGHEDDRAGHDLADQSLFRRVPLQDHFARIVALGKNADQFAFREHQQGADSLLRHLLNGFVDGLIGRYRKDSMAGFFLQDSRQWCR